MAVTCRDIMGLDICKKLKLLGGTAGLDKEITWPYIKNMDTISEWIHGGELIFVVGSREDISEKGLQGLMREAIKSKISGVVFLIGECYLRSVPRSVVCMADDYELPVFRMPFNLKLIDVTREISKTILMDKRVSGTEINPKDCTVLDLLLSGSGREQVLGYCYRRLQPLIEADRVLKTEYVFTLKNYIRCNNDLLHTSQEIYIHRNTMINRMKRISALLGENVNDPEVRNDFQNIFQIMNDYGEL